MLPRDADGAVDNDNDGVDNVGIDILTGALLGIPAIGTTLAPDADGDDDDIIGVGDRDGSIDGLVVRISDPVGI